MEFTTSTLLTFLMSVPETVSMKRGQGSHLLFNESDGLMWITFPFSILSTAWSACLSWWLLLLLWPPSSVLCSRRGPSSAISKEPMGAVSTMASTASVRTCPQSPFAFKIKAKEKSQTWGPIQWKRNMSTQWEILFLISFPRPHTRTSENSSVYNYKTVVIWGRYHTGSHFFL